MQLIIISLLLLGMSRCLASPPGFNKVELERGGCPMFWYSFRGHCYKYVATQVTWADAELHCVSLKANLVSIGSLEENSFVRNLIQNFDHSQGPTWIGLSDIHKESSWMWSDGSAVTFKQWNTGEPNNRGGTEHCVHINWGTEKQWNDYSCTATHPAVCKLRTACS